METQATQPKPANLNKIGHLFLARFDLGLLIIGVLYFLVNALYINFVPMWDGLQYTEGCLVIGVDQPFNPFNFSCLSHPSMLFMGLLALPQYLSNGNVVLLHLTVTLLSLASIWAFYKIGVFFFPTGEKSFSLYLVTFCFAFQPVIAGSALNINLDQGTLIFMVLYIYALVYRKPIWTIVFATLLIFTKEPALLLYPMVGGFYFLVFEDWTKSWRTFWDAILRNLYLLVPALIFFLYEFVRYLLDLPLIWVNNGLHGVFVPFPNTLNDPNLISYLVMAFLLQFNWIFTLMVIIGWVHWFVVRYRGRPKGTRITFKTPYQKGVLFLMLLFLGTSYVITRFETFSNPRYLIPIHPLLFLAAYWAWRNLNLASWLKQGALIITAALVFIACFTTIDPVSKAIYGTFRFGDHDMLVMSALIDSTYTYGQDELVYNYEYTRISDLQNMVYSDLKPTWSTLIMMNVYTDFTIQPGRLDPVTYNRTISDNGVLFPAITSSRFTYTFLPPDRMPDSLAAKPPEGYYIQLPYMTSEILYTGFQDYLNAYKVESTKTYTTSDGYSMQVSKLVLRDKNP